MLEQDKFNEIRQTSVGKDAEKIKSRVKEIWLPLKKPQRDEILGLSGLTIHAVMRSYQKGLLSLKLALAIAQTQQINPYYLAGASDESGEFSDEIINRFLTENGHAALAEGNVKPRRKYNRKSPVITDSTKENAPVASTFDTETGGSAAADKSADVVAAPAQTEDSLLNNIEFNGKTPEPTVTVSTFEPRKTDYNSLISAVQEKIRALTEQEQEKLNEMPLETAEQLLKGLYLRIEYSGEANRIVLLLKLLLLM